MVPLLKDGELAGVGNYSTDNGRKTHGGDEDRQTILR
jgi:hypothetical protein